jgi:hypothetical protein
VHRNADFSPAGLQTNLGYTFKQGVGSLSGYVNHKLSARHTLNAGFFADRYQFNFVDSVLNENTNQFENRFDYRGSSYLIQPYVQSKYRITENLVVNSGLHSQWFMLNNSLSLEPRLGMKWKFAPRQAFSAGYGLHSQMQPTYIYFYHIPGTHSQALHNKDLGFTRSHHFVLSYDHSLSRQVRIKAETYYQSLFKVPVTVRPSSFSLLNQGSTFERFFPDTLANIGTGENYGIELTLEKFFNNHYFFMLTGSLFESTYKGSDGIRRDTDFNGNFALNLLGGTEYTKKNKTFTLGGKLTWAGGRRYSPVDAAATQLANDVVIIDNLRNTLQFRNYFRADARLGFKLNSKRLTHEIALDLVNVFNIKNMLSINYVANRLNPELGYLRQEYQLGFLPLFYYKVDF